MQLGSVKLVLSGIYTGDQKLQIGRFEKKGNFLLKCIARRYEARVRVCVCCVCVWAFRATLIAIVSISYEISWISLAAFPRKQKTDKKKLFANFEGLEIAILKN